MSIAITLNTKNTQKSRLLGKHWLSLAIWTSQDYYIYCIVKMSKTPARSTFSSQNGCYYVVNELFYRICCSFTPISAGANLWNAMPSHLHEPNAPVVKNFQSCQIHVPVRKLLTKYQNFELEEICLGNKLVPFKLEEIQYPSDTRYKVNVFVFSCKRICLLV